MHSFIAVFPGQGSQVVGMGKNLFENFSVAREVFEEASDALGIDIKSLCFEGPMDQLTLTQNTQPCLLTCSVAAFRVAQKELDFKPAVAAGHSLGEYSALVAAGSLELSVAVKWVRKRGLAMQQAVPAGVGSMAAILGLEDDLVQLLCEAAVTMAKEQAQSEQAQANTSASPVVETVEPANYNAPGQIVIAGSTRAVNAAIGLVKSDARWEGGKAILLQVSAPFHCSLMQPAKKIMTQVFTEATLAELPKMPNFAYVPNRTGRATTEPGVILDLLIEQIDHPVLWRQSISGLLAEGYTSAVEFGPGKVLGGLIKRIALAEDLKCPTISVSDSDSLGTLQAALKVASVTQLHASKENLHV